MLSTSFTERPRLARFHTPGLGRRPAWRAEGVPLEPYRKLITSGGWSRCVKIRGGAGLRGLGLLPRYGRCLYCAEGSRGGTVWAGGP